MSKKIKNLPKHIYLQIGEDCGHNDWNDIYPSHKVTWCADKINDNDMEDLRQEFVEQYSALPPPNNLWEWIVENFEPKSLLVEAEVKPACEHCRSYEMTKEVYLQNFCSQFCIKMDKLYGWDVTENYCNKFVSKSV